MQHLTESEYKALLKKMPQGFCKNKNAGKFKNRAKYNNNRGVSYYDPDLKEQIRFDSNRELEYYLVLKQKVKNHEIRDLRRQVSIEIQPGFLDKNGKKQEAIVYKADFTYRDGKTDELHIIDVKGFKTDIYKLKKKLLAYKGIYIEEVY